MGCKGLAKSAYGTPPCSDAAALSYYVAAGVRIYSQDSWKLLFGDDGRKKVEAYIQQTVSWQGLALANHGCT